MEKAWSAMEAHAEAAQGRRIEALFEAPDRAAMFSLQACGMLFDYSKTALNGAALGILVDLASATGVEAQRDAMFAADKINTTEDRAVLHTALRNLDARIDVDGQDIMPEIRETLSRMQGFVKDVRSGAFKGQGGPITDVVNIGIGGSDLGPVMANIALTPYCNGPRVHFISNVDGADATDTLRGLDPATTLVIVASKTFTTIETMTNAETVRLWMAESVADPAVQFVALSSRPDRTAAFGIPEARTFGFGDFVGGRYSVWGPIGLSLMLAVGPEDFDEFLAGGAEMDAHFRAAPLADNLPILLALVGVWHHQGMGYPTRAVLPYEQRLLRLPAYLQQLEMESNGKRVTKAGAALPRETGPVVWGEPGTNGQHAFYQLLHQGTQVVPCEFLVGRVGHEPELAHHHLLLQANCLAQSEALMVGRSLETAREIASSLGYEGNELETQAAQRVFAGNRPSTTLIYERLDPRTLGRIVALYEHRVFVEGAILGINSFDQWGVELGKELATALGPVLSGEDDGHNKDGSTRMLANYLRGAG
ncbi:glucose-6-phosphate isomerase [Alisedimentitalea sp. MJ-SS2]|uniref:glucose-6-phosphate isomerase n=1 Tax=Aliisedimentitalea sp. MJ-SS2 TaxID=3049795 RepID=UPI00290E320E|nr:glucose-6-phosphate isomerase [Alisedimentitalea sp. MJ-SS2]MDU8929796.1 glucose-6-phosphate isomerase [Alisedimentitalea sp. MJ-SS2]